MKKVKYKTAYSCIVYLDIQSQSNLTPTKQHSSFYWNYTMLTSCT